MPSTIKNILLILGFVVLLPIVVFTLVQINKLNDNEAIVQSIYKKQLDAILFSLNQYSGDLMTNYANNIELNWIKSERHSLVNDQFATNNLSVASIGVATGDSIFSQQLNIKLPAQAWNNKIKTLLEVHQPLVERLTRYKQAEYLKLEPIGSVVVDGQSFNALLFIIESNTPCFIFYNSEQFIRKLMAPKIQQVTTEDIVVIVRETKNNTLIYSSEKYESYIEQSRALWLIPNFELGVGLKGGSIDGLIKERTYQNIVGIGILVLLIFLGAFLVYRNLVKEAQLSKAKADFVANVSHEIRTPLALISMFNETLLLQRVPTEEKKQAYYKIISKETARLKNIVNKILSFSQIDAEKKHFNLVDSSPEVLIHEIVHSYDYHLKEKGFTLILDLKASDTTLLIDKDAFSEALINLIDNAIKYSNKEKEITIRSVRTNRNYVLSISDKGNGIEKIHQKKVFEKFYRVTTTDLYESKGTGLGLALVKGIMTAHGGRITLESRKNQGSTFHLYFPLNPTT